MIHLQFYFDIHDSFVHDTLCLNVSNSFSHFIKYRMINFALTEKLGKRNSEFQMGFEPTTLRDLVGYSMVSKGEMWVLTRTASRSHIVKSGQAHI